MTELNLLYSDVEDDLRSTIRDLLGDRLNPSAVTAMYDGDRTVVDPLWKAVGHDLGLAGLLLGEDQGGAGASAREAAVVCEELGRAVAPIPFLTSAVVATVAIEGSGHQLVADLAAGETTAALAVPFTTSPDGALNGLVATDGAVSGTVTSVAGALEADVLLVPVQEPDGLAIYAVPVAGATVAPVASLDMSRQLADVILDAAPGTRIRGDAALSVRAAIRMGAAMLASEQVGVASWCLSTTVDYLRERRQFGRPLGGFQALKHRLADLYVKVESGTAVARYAAAALAAEDSDAEVAIAVAASYCGNLAVTAAEEALQLHGGIGMTWEYPVHLYLKRAKADQLAFGHPGEHRRRLADLVDLPIGPTAAEQGRVHG
ncbi:MAG: acyl-CoA dehydrogenase family protein [Nocardioides sp.]